MIDPILNVTTISLLMYTKECLKTIFHFVTKPSFDDIYNKNVRSVVAAKTRRVSTRITTLNKLIDS